MTGSCEHEKLSPESCNRNAEAHG